MSRPTLLILRAGAIGDFVLTLPAFLALRRKFPAHRIVLAGRAGMLPLARGSLADDTLPFDSPLLTPLFVRDHSQDLGPLADRLGDLDLVVAWLPDATASIVADGVRALGAARWLGAPPKPTYGHAADHFVDSLAPLGIVQADRTPRLTLTPAMEAAGTEFWHQHCLGDAPVAAMHVGSGAAAKCWPLDRYVRLAADAVATGMRIILVTGPAEDGLALPDIAGIEVVRGLEIPVLAAVLAHCAAFVGNDSGITHLAAAVGVPVLALFGPTDPAMWAPRGPSVRVLRGASGNIGDLSYDTVRGAFQEMTSIHWRSKDSSIRE